MDLLKPWRNEMMLKRLRRMTMSLKSLIYLLLLWTFLPNHPRKLLLLQEKRKRVLRRRRKETMKKKKKKKKRRRKRRNRVRLPTVWKVSICHKLELLFSQNLLLLPLLSLLPLLRPLPLPQTLLHELLCNTRFFLDQASRRVQDGHR